MEYESISKALAQIIEKDGTNVLLDGRKCLALLKDLAPDRQDDISLLRHAFDGGYAKLLVNVSTDREQQIAVYELYSRLKDKVRLSEEAANDTCMIFVQALGWKAETPYKKPEQTLKQPVPEKPQSAPPKPQTKPVTTSAPRTVPNSTQSYKSNNKFLNNIAYEWSDLDFGEKIGIILLVLLALVTLFDLIGGIFLYGTIGPFVFKVSIGIVIFMLAMLPILIKLDSDVEDLPDFFWFVYGGIGTVDVIFMIFMIVRRLLTSD